MEMEETTLMVASIRISHSEHSSGRGRSIGEADTKPPRSQGLLVWLEYLKKKPPNTPTTLKATAFASHLLFTRLTGNQFGAPSDILG